MTKMTNSTAASTDDFRQASIDAAKTAGAEVFANLRKGEEAIKDFALRLAIASKLSFSALKKEAELEGASMPNAKFRHSSIISYLTGFYKLKDDKKIDTMEKSRLSKQISYAARLTDALVQFIKAEKLTITGEPGEFEQIAKRRDETTISKILEDLGKSNRPSTSTRGNEEKLRDDDMMEKVAKAYRSSKEPIATFKAPGLKLPQEGVAYAIIQSGGDGQAEVYDIIQAKTKSSIELLREVETLPSVNDDERLNFVLDILHAASKACPDRPSASPGAKTGGSKEADDTENCRQFFFDPANDAIFVGYARSTSLPSFKVGGLSKWPNAPTEPGLLRTQQRRKVDKVANRFDRIKQTLEPFPREEGQTWLSKLLVTPQGGSGGLPLQVDAFVGHRLDFFRPSTAEAKWEVEFEFDRLQLQQLWQDHLGPYARSKKSEKEARIATLGFSKDGATFAYPGIDPVGVSCRVATPLKKRLEIQFVGRDLAEIVDGVLALNAAGPVSAKADSSGLIALSVKSGDSPCEFYLATVPPGSSDRSDRFYSSVRRELEDADAAAEAKQAA